jgi:uncharacterized protein YigE (DUF2233 family)
MKLRALIWLGAMLSGLLLAGTARAVNCEQISFDGNSYTICDVTAGEDLRLFLRDDSGAVMGGFAALNSELNGALAFAMNAGMYDPELNPVGLYIEDGEQLKPASDGGGYGNFGLLPNGILCISDTIRVWESAAWAEAAPDCRYATQSGPMLVIGGKFHPEIREGSTSRLIRNGVGSSADGSHAVFAIANQPVNFYDFARLFRDHLHLPDALFLDANISQIYAPSLGRRDYGPQIGPMIGVVDATGGKG